MIYLLDTNACIQILRGRHQLLLQRFRAQPPSDLRVCSVVTAELLYGAFRSSRPAAQRASVTAFLQQYESLSFDEPAARVYADIRYQLEVQGTPISIPDLQIAAITLVNNLTLVTHNTKEFKRVPGLNFVDWEV